MNHDKLTEQEKELFESLPREVDPPAFLEERITDELRQRGLIKKHRAVGRWLSWSGGIAAGILLFAAGLFYGQLTQNTMNTINPSKGYMLLLHEDDSFQPGEPVAMFNEYSAWMENAEASGITITGQELTPGGTLLSANDSREVDSDKRTTGYFIIEAGSMQEAEEIARANPHLKYGGQIEVKPFMVR